MEMGEQSANQSGPALQVSHTVGYVHPVIAAASVNIATIVPIGAAGARITLRWIAALKKGYTIGDIKTVIVVAAVDIPDGIIAAGSTRAATLPETGFNRKT
jgi:hypothetical protein